MTFAPAARPATSVCWKEDNRTRRRGKAMNVDQAQSRVIAEQPTAVRRATLAPAELPAWFAEAYADIATYLGSQGVKHAGPPFARYHIRPDGRFDVEAGFPVTGTIDGKIGRAHV